MQNLQIIMSMKSPNHCELNALGHEIHISRYILLDMLEKKYITKNNTIITLFEDRKFLYTNLFANVITYTEFLSEKKGTGPILNICQLSYTPHLTNEKILQFEKIVNYPIRNYIPADIFEAYNITLPTSDNLNPEMNINDLLNNINYIPIDNLLPVNSNFIIIHHRIININQPCHVINDDNKLHLEKIIDKLKNKYNTIFIFCINKRENIQDGDLNIIYINKLDVFASLMYHANCDMVISEWSGGGQLSHYCHNKKVCYYFHHYAEHNYSSRKDDLLKFAETGIYNAFDFHKSTKLDICMYKNIDELLNE